MASLSPEMPPDVQSFAELAQKPEIMMICHLLMSARRHFRPLNRAKYRSHLGFRQTTICTASDDINSCSLGDRQRAQWIGAFGGIGGGRKVGWRGAAALPASGSKGAAEARAIACPPLPRFNWACPN